MPTDSPGRALGAEILAFLLAATCAGCDLPGTLLCDGCRGLLTPADLETRTPGGLRVRSVFAFDSVAARCIRRLKDHGETMLARPLGRALADTLHDELAVVDDAMAVPVPTSRAAFRRRGYRVPDLLISRAGSPAVRLLTTTGVRGDQRGLDAAARAQNVRGSMRARWRGDGAALVLVDDVMTTGATFDEAARAASAAGFRILSAVALAATPRHSERIADASGTRRK